jgi:acyl transferase domain-containing protein
MREIGGLYEDLLKKTMTATATRLPFFSSVTGKRGSDDIDLGPSYWRQNLQSPVLFNSAMQACLDEKPTDHLFVELGPHSALAGPVRQIFNTRGSKDNLTYMSALVRGKNASETFLRLVGQLHQQLIPINFKMLTPTDASAVLLDLPLYQWKHDFYWNESRLTKDWWVELRCSL